MLDVLSLMSKVVFSPVWVLWKFYGILWWAFGEGNPPATQSSDHKARVEASGAAFEVVDSRPRPVPQPKPVGLLRAGFIGTLATSLLVGIAANASAHAHWLSESAALGAWIWTSCVALVGSIFAVRRVAQQRAAKAAAPKRGFAAVAPAVKAAVAAAGTNVRRARPAWCVAKAAAAKAGGFSHRTARSAWAGAQQAVQTFRQRTAAANVPPAAPLADNAGPQAQPG